MLCYRPTRKRLRISAIKNRLPLLAEVSSVVEAGGLISYAADEAESYRRAAWYVDKILKGAKPADLPVEQPTKFEFVINLKTAKALNLTIPQSVLFRADQGDQVRRGECQVSSGSRQRKRHEEQNHGSYSLRHALCALLFRRGAAAEESPADRYLASMANSNDPGPRVEAFRQGLRDLGYVEGKNILVEYRYIEGNRGPYPKPS